MGKRKFGILQVGIVVVLLAAAIGALALQRAIQPTAPGEPFYVRYDASAPIGTVLADLENRGVVRSAFELPAEADADRLLSLRAGRPNGLRKPARCGVR